MINKKSSILIAMAIFISLQVCVFAGDNTQSDKNLEKQQVYTVRYTKVPDVYRATGTVESRTEANISPRITARTIDVYVRDGDYVKKNQMLMKLEDGALQASVMEIESRIDSINAKIGSAKNAVKSAEAGFELADTEHKRNKRLYSSKAISQKLYEQAASNYKKTTADLHRAQQDVQSLIAEKKATEQALVRSKMLFAYSEIKSPINGIVGERSVDPGDLAIPGKILMKVFDPSRLMLEIPVRESLIKKIKLGNAIIFEVSALNKTYEGEIREIVPYVDTKTRTFLVKVCIDHAQGLVPGMYGIAKIELGEKKELLVSEKSITRIGQIETVMIRKDGNALKAFVRTIKSSVSDMRIVLSGLSEGDEVIIPKTI